MMGLSGPLYLLAAGGLILLLQRCTHATAEGLAKAPPGKETLLQKKTLARIFLFELARFFFEHSFPILGHRHFSGFFSLAKTGPGHKSTLV
jgi:hypothetical protein